MGRLPTIEQLNESNDGFGIGDKVKFKPEALDNMSDPELIDLDTIYDVVKVTPKLVIEDTYGNAQRINKKDIKYLIKQS